MLVVRAHTLEVCGCTFTPTIFFVLDSSLLLLEVLEHHAKTNDDSIKRELDTLLGLSISISAKLDDTRLKNRQLLFEVDALSRTRNAIRASLKSLDAQEASMNQEATNLAALSRDFLEKLTIKTEERRSSLARLASLNESRNATNMRSATLASIISSLEQQLGVAEGQLQTATKALADREADLKQLITTAVDQASSLSRDVATLEASKLDLSKQVAGLQAAVDKLNAERAALLIVLDELSSSVAAAQRDVKLHTAAAEASEDALGEPKYGIDCSVWRVSG